MRKIIDDDGNELWIDPPTDYGQFPEGFAESVVDEFGPVMVYGSAPEHAAYVPPDLKPTKHPHLFIVRNQEGNE